VEIDLPVNAPRRRTLTRYASISTKPSYKDGRSQNAPLSKEQLQKEKTHCHWCQLARFSTHDDYPIKIVNDVNNETLPEDFEFIEQSILCKGVEAADEGFRTGCECGDDEDCMTVNCNCLQDMDFHKVNPSPRAKVYAYRSRGLNKNCLRPEILDSRDPIYECHERCSCSLNCNNRVVERGRKVPLEIFRTSDGRGWGMLESIHLI
jgi:[histone H3]-lysine9 N-trimethyltransferase SUV39H